MRTEYLRSGSNIVEWYEERVAGVEQGFTIEARPPREGTRAGAGPLQLIIALQGEHLQSEMSGDSNAILLRDLHGRHVATYSNLKAWDATGRALVAKMDLVAGDVSLEVEESGAAYPITIDPTLEPEIKIAPGDLAIQDQFGVAVAVSGSTAVIGAPYHDEGVPFRTGLVYVFARHGAEWVLEQQLTAFNVTADARYAYYFGHSVAIAGNTIVVGSFVNGFDGASYQTEHGEAYVFERRGGTWEPQQKLVADDGEGLDVFGDAVAISGDTIVVGSAASDTSTDESAAQRGAAYIFARDGTRWYKQQKLLADDGLKLDHFGCSVSVSGDTAIIGAYLNGNTVTESKGAAYVFTKKAAVWTQQTKLVPPPNGGDEFGLSVGISGDTAIVGTPGFDFGQHRDQGAAYLYTRTDDVWSNGQRLLAAEGNTQDAFGISVAVSGGTAVVGAHLKDVDGKSNQGKAYVFQQTDTGWIAGQELVATDGGTFQSFGQRVAASGDTIIAGAPGDRSTRGSAYIYQTLDSDGDGIPDQWEKNGITVGASSTVVGVGNLVGRGTFINLKKMGADPMHKDLFIHADWMHSGPGAPIPNFKPSVRTMAQVIAAFAQAPVTNPDGKPGINLHVDIGKDRIMNPLTGEKWGPLSAADEQPYHATLGTYKSNGATPPVQVYDWTAFDVMKGDFFGVSRRRPVFHYVLFCNNYDGAKKSGGLSRAIGASDFLIAYGQVNGGTLIALATTFMHELGHNLGLQHGGDEETNYKPNYLSIMNYAFGLEGLVRSNGGHYIDYSRRALPTLNENLLNEAVGISNPAYFTFWRDPAPDDFYYRALSNGALDWNLNGIQDSAPIAFDLNRDRAFTLLTSAEDWTKLRFDGGGRIGNAAGVDVGDRMSTIIDEAPIDEIATIVPPGILKAEIDAPQDEVTITTNDGPGSLTATFDGSASTATNATIVSWVWDFGDGTSGSGAVTTHSYGAPGDYFVTLTVTDSNGRINVVPLTYHVSIHAPPPPTPTPAPTPGPGDVDTTFKTAVTTTYGATIYKTLVQPDGKVIVGGDFESFGGFARRNIARLNQDGTCDTSFDPGLALTDVLQVNFSVPAPVRFGLTVLSLALQPDGKLLVGLQAARGGRNGASVCSKTIVRLNADGSEDPSFQAKGFDPGFSVPAVHAIVVQPDGRIIIGGALLYDNGGTKAGIARLNADGTLDESFLLPPGVSTYGGLNYTINAGAAFALALQPDGKVIIGGSFEYVGQTVRPAVARLNADGSLDNTYSAPSPSTISGFTSDLHKFSVPAEFALQPDGKVVVGGYLTPSGIAPFPFARLNSDGSRDTSFSTTAGSDVLGPSGGGRGVFLQPDGKLIVAGEFQKTTPARSRIERLNADGTIDTSFDTPGVSGGYVKTAALLPDGRVIVAGSYPTFAGQPVESIVRVNPDGLRDQSFTSNGAGMHTQVNSILRQPDGKLVVGFSYAGAGQIGQPLMTKLNSTRLGGIGRINADGTTDLSFTSPFEDSIIYRAGLQPDGRMIVTGSFRLLGGKEEKTFARLLPDGTLDTGFTPPASVTGGPIAIQPDGKIVTAGYHPSGFFGLVRLNPDGSRDDATFSAALPGGYADQIALQPDGRMVIAGSFSLPDGRAAGLARLNADGSFDPSFDPGKGPDDLVYALLLQPDGKVLISGKFFNYNGTPRPQMARVNSDGTLDSSFVPATPDAVRGRQVRAMALQLDGKVVAGGFYSGDTGQLPPNRVFRLNTDGSLDPSLPQTRSGIEGTLQNVIAIALQPGGKVVVGGEFNVINDVACLGIARLLGTAPTVLANISTRLRVEQGDNALIGGFIITGTGQKKLLLRALGPSLPIPGHLDDPTLELYSGSGESIATNDDWRDAPNLDDIISTSIPPPNALESAIVTNLNPGAYTAVVRGTNGASGVGLVEAYDLDATAGSKLANISTRGRVQTGNDVMIAGVIIVGSAPQKVIVRAIGSSLSIEGRLADPVLELYDENGVRLQVNNDWAETQQAEIEATGIPPTDSRESAMVRTLTPSNYTAIVRGVGGSTGVAVVEVYALD